MREPCIQETRIREIHFIGPYPGSRPNSQCHSIGPGVEPEYPDCHAHRVEPENPDRAMRTGLMTLTGRLDSVYSNTESDQSGYIGTNMRERGRAERHKGRYQCAKPNMRGRG